MLTNPPTTLAPTVVNGFLKDIDPKNVLLAPVGLNAFDFNGFVPTTYSYHFGVQSKLPMDFILDTAYVGSQNRHELQRRNLNAIPYGDIPSAESGLHEVFRHMFTGALLW